MKKRFITGLIFVVLVLLLGCTTKIHFTKGADLEGNVLFNAFERADTGNICGSIYDLDLSTSQTTLLTSASSTEFSLSPDGNKLVFVDDGKCSESGENEEKVFVYYFDSGEKEVINDIFDGSGFVWSSDSQKILFGCDLKEQGEGICVFDINTKTVPFFGEGDPLFAEFDWVDNENFVLSFGSTIQSVNVESGEVQDLSLQGMMMDVNSAGDKLSFVRQAGSEEGQIKIFTYNLVSKDEKRLTSSGINIKEMNPLWSPNSKYITFETSPYVSKSFSRGNIAVVNVETGKEEFNSERFSSEVLVTSEGEGGLHPAWSLDSQYLGYISGRGKINIISVEKRMHNVVEPNKGTIHTIAWR
tara:strand:- start:1348 stop:2418 length:1071 start_codon:yes stop_codon:yes gene_type:complete